MARYGSDDVTVNFDNSGGTPVDMSQYVQEINGVDIEAMLEEAHSFGDSWVEQAYTGLRRVGDITLGGFYDDTSTTGPDAIFNSPGGGPRTLQIVYGSTKSTSVETIIKSYRRTLSRGTLHKYEVVLTPTGAVTEA